MLALACLAMQEYVSLKFKFKVECSPRHAQIVPKWHLDGQPGGTDFLSTCAWHDTQKKFPFLLGANTGTFRLLRNGGSCMLEVMVQGGVFPAT